VLNEIFAAEKDVGKISVYTLTTDGKVIEGDKIRSSGVIISTGTGSSGWLLSARRMS
jgi:NAD kinase